MSESIVQRKRTYSMGDEDTLLYCQATQPTLQQLSEGVDSLTRSLTHSLTQAPRREKKKETKQSRELIN